MLLFVIVRKVNGWRYIFNNIKY